MKERVFAGAVRRESGLVKADRIKQRIWFRSCRFEIILFW